MSRRKKPTRSALTAPQAQSAALERMQPLLDSASFKLLEEELQRPLYPALRINPLKTSQEFTQQLAERYGWTLEPIPFCPTGWWVTANQTPISQTLEYRMGHYYIQDAASMLPAELFSLDPNNRPLILDMAASPGGKTTHLISQTLDRGLVLANDSGLDRTTALRLILQTWGAINVAASRFPGEKFGRWYPDTFDLVLLDAPCSMQSLRSTESHPMRTISPREQRSLSVRQAGLLASALAAVKVDGQVVYSTCTLAPEEDEGVLDELLRRYRGSFRIENLSARLPVPAPGLTSAFGQNFEPDVQGAARLWPHIMHTSGFFAALITKIGPVSLPSEPPPSRPLRMVNQESLPKKEAAQFITDYLAAYGFDIEFVLENQDLVLWRSPGAIYAVPRAFLDRFANLPCQLMGLKIAEGKPEDWVPSHEWMSRFAGEIKAGRVALPTEHLSAWLRGEDASLQTMKPAPHNPVVAVFDMDGRFIGRGKIQNDRLKNLLPRRLV